MPSHHAQTALRMLESVTGKDIVEEALPLTGAVVHAELETAAQLERIADAVESVGKILGDIGNFAISSGLNPFNIKLFNPEEN